MWGVIFICSWQEFSGEVLIIPCEGGLLSFTVYLLLSLQDAELIPEDCQKFCSFPTLVFSIIFSNI